MISNARIAAYAKQKGISFHAAARELGRHGARARHSRSKITNPQPPPPPPAPRKGYWWND